MAMFGKDASEKSDAKTNGSGDGTLSIVAGGMTITGDVDCAGILKVEGRVEGTVRTQRQLLVGRQGEIVGDVETNEAVVGGTVRGSIVASERVELKEGALVEGDIVTKNIVVLEGARINGHVRMMDASAGAASPPLAPGAKATQIPGIEPGPKPALATGS